MMRTKHLLVKTPFIYSFIDSMKIFCLVTQCQILDYRQSSHGSTHFLLLKSLLASELCIAHVIPERDIVEVKEGGERIWVKTR